MFESWSSADISQPTVSGQQASPNSSGTKVMHIGKKTRIQQDKSNGFGRIRRSQFADVLQHAHTRVAALGALCAAALVLAPATPASASSCGTELARSHGAVIGIRTSNTTCRIGRDVAGRWYQRGTRHVSDQLGRPWTCRITQAATGSDPGYIAHTKVRCTRSRAVVTFQIRS